MTIVYVVTGDHNSTAYWICLTSSATARYHHPDTEIVWITDRELDPSMSVYATEVLGKHFTVIPFTEHAYDALYASRYLKIRIPHLIDGDCLYLDNDTIVRERLSFGFPRSFTISGCRNTGHPSGGTARSTIASFYEPLSWPEPVLPFINGGVLVFSGSGEGRQFSDCWLAYWKDQVHRLQRHNDQPALNRAIADFSDEFFLLDQSFNCQVRHVTNYEPRARVFHYYGSVGKLLSSNASPFFAMREVPMTDPSAFRSAAKRLAQLDFPFVVNKSSILLCLRIRHLRLLIFMATKGRVCIGKSFPPQPL